MGGVTLMAGAMAVAGAHGLRWWALALTLCAGAPLLAWAAVDRRTAVMPLALVALWGPLLVAQPPGGAALVVRLFLAAALVACAAAVAARDRHDEGGREHEDDDGDDDGDDDPDAPAPGPPDAWDRALWDLCSRTPEPAGAPRQ